jgi:Na+-transporting methylmalonyl-CoA/oxaloacetate decarboxylase gamma subunit
MCPFRVLLIFLSALIAIFATMAAMANDPTEEELEAERIRQENVRPHTHPRRELKFNAPRE